MTEKQRIEWEEAISNLKEAFAYATKELALFSLIISGIKVDPEDVDILNAEVIEK
jgi:hypothetical protein